MSSVTVVVNTRDVLLVLLSGVLVAQGALCDTQQGAVLLGNSVQLQILNEELLQRTLSQVSHDAAVLIRHTLPHTSNLPCTLNSLTLLNYLGDHAPIQHLLSSELTGGHHVVVAALGAQEVLSHQAHAVAGNQAALSMGNLDLGVLSYDGNVAQESGIPVETRTRHSADGGNINIEHHVLDQVGVVEILMLETLSGQLGVSLPAVCVGLDHPVVADVGEDDDLVLPVHGQDTGQLADCTMGHAGMMHGAVVGLPGDLENTVLTLHLSEILKPLFVLVKLGELDVRSQRLCHS